MKTPTRRNLFGWLAAVPFVGMGLATKADEREEYIVIDHTGERHYTVEERKVILNDEGIYCGLADFDVSRARLRVDTRKWVLSKLLPKEFA